MSSPTIVTQVWVLNALIITPRFHNNKKYTLYYRIYCRARVRHNTKYTNLYTGELTAVSRYQRPELLRLAEPVAAAAGRLEPVAAGLRCYSAERCRCYGLHCSLRQRARRIWSLHCAPKQRCWAQVAWLERLPCRQSMAAAVASWSCLTLLVRA